MILYRHARGFPPRGLRLSPLWRLWAAVTAAALALPGHAQSQPSAPQAAPVSVVMLSDLHLDPFSDPAKFKQLNAARAQDWDAIFAQADSATRAEDTAKLSAACPVRGVDAPPALVQASLRTAHQAAPGARFAVVSGDLLAHAFDCRYKYLAGKSTEAEYAAFAVKTVSYVALELKQTFGAMPVYVALGNNDSGCGDYIESSGSVFLRSLATSLAGPAAARSNAAAARTNDKGRERGLAERQFAIDGSYSVRLPEPIVRGRLIVLQDLFLSRNYKPCAGEPATPAPAGEIAWLENQLAHARDAHEQVWVMAHLPPGIDVYSTTRNQRKVCEAQSPDLFLVGEDLVHVLTSYSDIVRLALFGHTHNDEMHLLRPEPGAKAGTDSTPGTGPVVMKQIPSISPVNGNLPSVTIAEVDPHTATLEDFRVLQANNMTGIDTRWSEEYQFSKLYKVRGYTPENVGRLLDGFLADRSGLAQASTDYQQMFFVGGGRGTLAIHLVWPQYACAMENVTVSSYRTCVCQAK